MKNKSNRNNNVQKVTITGVMICFICSCIVVTPRVQSGYTPTSPPQELRENANSPYINNTVISNPPVAHRPPPYYPSRNIGIVPPVGGTPIVVNQPGREGNHEKEGENRFHKNKGKNGEHGKKPEHEKEGQNSKGHKKGEENKKEKKNNTQNVTQDKQNNGNNAKDKNGKENNHLDKGGK